MEETVRSIKDKMRGYWKDLLARECGLSSFQLSNKPQPCPICGDGEDRYRFDDKNGDGTWYCNYGHGGKQAGDGYSFLMHHKNLENKEVVRIMKNYLGLTDKKKEEPEKSLTVGGCDVFTLPAPDLHYKPGATLTVMAQKTGKKLTKEYQYFWEWKNPNGERVGYIGRTKDKVLHQILHTDKGWIQGTIGDKRPAFCSKLDKDKILIVEGEKSAELVAKTTEKYSVVTWVGGASNNTCVNTDWSFLDGKEVFLFPDNDYVGIKAMNKIYDRIKNKCTALLILPNETRKPKWDLGDLTEETLDFDDDITEMIKHAHSVPVVTVDHTNPITKLVKPLGFLDSQCYIMHWHVEEVKKVFVQEVKAVSSSSITKNELMFWSDWEDWKRIYGEKPDMENIVPDLVRACKNKGVYDESKVRGAGFWQDKGRVVFHAGTRIYVDEQLVNFSDLDTEFIYQSRPPVVTSNFDFNKLLNQEEKDQIIQVLCVANSAHWMMTLYMIGWIALATLCGCLPWRPHMYIEGKRGSGKSSVFRVYKALTGNFSEDIQDSPTEAAIRQRLKCDARPVIFDESELKTRVAEAEREKINGLKRAACSDSSGAIIRGSASGHAQIFKPRFMMVEAGINKPKNNEADASREVIVELLHESMEGDTEGAPEFLSKYFDDLPTFEQAFGEGGEGGIVGEWADKGIADKFVATVGHLYPVIMENYAILKRAIAKKSDGRTGDTHGEILGAAAAFMIGTLMTGGTMDEKLINAFLDQACWNTITQLKTEETTETELLDFIQELTIPIEDSEGRKITSTVVGAVNDYIESVNRHHFAGTEKASDILRALGLLGITVKQESSKWYVYIASKNHLLSNKLSSTSHYYRWNSVLKRLPETVMNELFYCPGQRSQRGIRIPYDTYFTYTRPTPPSPPPIVEPVEEEEF